MRLLRSARTLASALGFLAAATGATGQPAAAPASTAPPSIEAKTAGM